MKTISFLKSKKFWVNALTILVAICAYFGITPDQNLTDNLASYLVLLSPLINLVMTMFYTKRAITPTLS